MTRLGALRRQQLDPDQRSYWDVITDGRHGTVDAVVTPDGGLRGPFNAMLRTPAVGHCVTTLGQALRHSGSVPANLRELVIITVGAHNQANYVWTAHHRIARAAGTSDDAVTAIGEAHHPHFADPDEALVHRLITQLLQNHRVDQVAFDAAVALLGEAGVTELVTLAGLYSIASFVVNVFDVDVPESETRQWP